MAWCIWVYFGLSLCGLLVSAHEHGKPRKPLNFWNMAISSAICWTLLYFGGAFHSIGLN